MSDQFISLVNSLFKKNIEVIFFKSGILGEVMLNDGRFNKELIRMDLERLNTEVGGKSIKAGSVLLLPEYKDENICFVCYNVNLTNAIQTLFHELCHFEDPFACNIPYSEETEEGPYIKTERFIQNSIQVLLNEFYAEYRSFIIVFKLKIKGIIKGLNLIYLVERYNKLIKDCYNNFNTKLSEIEFSDHFNFQYEVIKYSINYFFKYFIGFLGMWGALKESYLNTNLLNTTWNDAVDLVKAFNNASLCEILNQIRDKTLLVQDLDLFQNKEKILKSLTKLFIEYYRKDFLNLIY